MRGFAHLVLVLLAAIGITARSVIGIADIVAAFIIYKRRQQRDLTDQLTAKQVAMLARDEQNDDVLDAVALLLMAKTSRKRASLAWCTAPITKAEHGAMIAPSGGS